MVLTLLSAFLLVATLLLLVPVGVFFVQILASGWAEAPARDGARRRPSAAILMPAHDEAAGIARSIAALLPQMISGDRLLVVADNCTDETATTAAAAGAEVTERTNLALRGKGYALDHGVRHLAAVPPDIVVVVDADCVVSDGSLDRLVRECARVERPVQGLYLMHAPPGAALKQRMAQFAWAVRNELRPMGWHRFGLPCQLMGTGMAFPWPLLSVASLASGNLVEDMQLGLDLAAAGAPPRFCHAALVTSVFPENAEGSLAQRTRWEHGHLSMIAAKGVPLLWRGIVERRLALVAMALDVCVPPLAALALLLSTLVALGGLLLIAGGAAVPLGIALFALALTALAVASAWRRVGRQSISLPELLSVPGYVVAKIPIYVRLFTARQLQWIRTRRDGGKS